MVASVIGCGSSAQHWGKQQFDLSIGVNDCYKHGYQPDQLVIVNFPSKFDKQRMDTILKTRPKKVFTHTVQWKKHFSNVELLHLSPFTGYVRDNMIYSSKTSPMVAISLALKQGATDIVLYGVDFTNHKMYRKGQKHGDHEITQYLKFFKRIQEKKINVWLGAEGSCFDNHLPMYQSVLV
jgi:hypothetical protein